MLEPTWGEIIIWAVLSGAAVLTLLIGLISRVPADYHKHEDFSFDYSKPYKNEVVKPVRERKPRKTAEELERIKQERSFWNQ